VPFAVGDLRCEFSSDPLGIDEGRPRLSWRIIGSERGERQTAWEVVAGRSRAALGNDQDVLWDSGKVASANSTLLAYEGPALSSCQQVFWKVRAWDAQGNPSPWSPTATWTMGLLSPGDWKGAWISSAGETESLLLRGEFVVRPRLVRALAYTSGLGQYEFYVNGSKAGMDLLSPGWTNYDAAALYDTRDVTGMLHEGRNAAGFLLGNGIYDVVKRDRFVKFTGFFGPLRAILHLRLEYEDGSVEAVGTDGSWRSLPGPITAGNIYSGEDYDARLEPVGWAASGFDDRAWARTVAVPAPGALRGHGSGSQPLRAFETEHPVAVQRFPDGTAVYDFGQNASHMPLLRVSGPAGSVVRMTPSEVVNPNGTINRNTMDGKNRGNAWWQYTKSTDAEETWFPKFYYVGCRYMKVQGFASQSDLPAHVPAEDSADPSVVLAAPPAGAAALLPKVESLDAVVVHADAAPLGKFATSNGLLNRIHDLVLWSQRSNMVSVLTDCPHREKLGWLEQYHLNGPSVRYEFDAARIFAKGMQDMADDQTAEGLVPNIAPEFVKFQGPFRAAAEWGAAFIIVPWQQYEFTGDDGLLRTHYPGMRRYFTYLESRANGDVLSEGLGDWFDIGPNGPGPAQNTPPPVTASAFYYYDAVLLARTAALLGHGDEARDYQAKAARIRSSYNRHFYHDASGSYATGSQCSDALALVLGIVERQNESRVLASLVADVEKHGNSMTTGDIGFRFLLQALAAAGRSDVVYRMINQDEKPGYGYMLRQGATSLTESWDANLNTSHNHFMLGQVTEWFYRDLAGIDVDPEGLGFRKILLRPSPVGDLAWVDATYDSAQGPIAVRWDHGGGTLTYRATIPANTTATLFMPAREGSEVSEGGQPASQSQGVIFLRRDGDRSVYSIESGSYAFLSKW
jgi:alpha-L-rhamnosidase